MSDEKKQQSEPAPKKPREFATRHTLRPFGRTKPHLLITAKAIVCQRCQASVQRPIEGIVELLHDESCAVVLEATRIARERKVANG